MPIASNDPPDPVLSPQTARITINYLVNACARLDTCRCLKTVKDLRDKAEACRQYARSVKLEREFVNKAAEAKIRAERRIGQLLADMQLHGGDHVSGSRGARPSLKQLNISHSQSARWQRVTAVPEAVFLALVDAAERKNAELSTAALLRKARELSTKSRDHNGNGSRSKGNGVEIAREEIIAELGNHALVFDRILADIYDSSGPVEMTPAMKKYLKQLIEEFGSLISELRKLADEKGSTS